MFPLDISYLSSTKKKLSEKGTKSFGKKERKEKSFNIFNIYIKKKKNSPFLSFSCAKMSIITGDGDAGSLSSGNFGREEVVVGGVEKQELLENFHVSNSLSSTTTSNGSSTQQVPEQQPPLVKKKRNPPGNPGIARVANYFILSLSLSLSLYIYIYNYTHNN